MSKGSSPRGDITGNTYTDLGAFTEEAYRISLSSRTLAREEIGNFSNEDRVRQRCSIAVGDFSMAGLMRFCHGPIEAGLAALGKKAAIVTDIRMVQVGVQKKGHESRVICALDHGEDLARERGITRSRAGILSLKEEIPGAVIVIGNAPSALLSVCDLARDGFVPALVIGTPVGFVKAAESKEELRSLDVPSISTVGTRGGTPVAVAAMNEIVTIFAEKGSG